MLSQLLSQLGVRAVFRDPELVQRGTRTRFRRYIDQKIYIAFGPGVITSNGTKEADIRCAVTGSDLSYFIAFRIDVFLNCHKSSGS